MALTAYKPNQGAYARSGAAAALLLLDLLASWRLFDALTARGRSQFDFFGFPMPYAVIWSGLLFLLLAGAAMLLTRGYTTGIAGLDRKTHGLIDLLIDTQNELQKVSWPNKEQLTRSTTVVLVCIVLMGGFLFVVDILLSYGAQRLMKLGQLLSK